MKKFIYLLLILNLGVTVLFWWMGSSPLLVSGSRAGILIALGRLAGLLAELTILVQLVLVSRTPFIEKAFGFDKLNQLHRKIGFTLAATIIFHPLLIISGYALDHGVSFSDQFFDFLRNWEDVLSAFLGLIVILVVAFFALPRIRRKMRYEVWHLIHLLIYVGVFLVFGHQVKTADVSFGLAFYYWYFINFSVFGALLFYRFIHPFLVFGHHRFYVECVVPETHDVYSVYITGRHMERFRFEAGQYIHVLFLSKGFFEPHPFSLSAAPNGKHLRLSIKAVGDFTSRIRDVRPGTKVILEGPFGRFTERAAERQKYLLIAGGIGITPIRSLIESLSKKGSDMVLLYGNKTPRDIVFKSEIESFLNRHHHVFSHEDHESHEKGYIDLEKIKRLVPDFAEREIYLCGPKTMMESIIAILRKEGIPKSQIHYERFAY